MMTTMVSELEIPHTFGIRLIREANEKIKNVLSKIEEHFIWLDEILVVCKESFERPNLETLPKTPSAKIRRGCVKKRKSASFSELFRRSSLSDTIEENRSNESLPVRRTQRKVSKMPQASIYNTRSTKNKKNIDNLGNSRSSDVTVESSTRSSCSQLSTKGATCSNKMCLNDSQHPAGTKLLKNAEKFTKLKESVDHHIETERSTEDKTLPSEALEKVSFSSPVVETAKTNHASLKLYINKARRSSLKRKANVGLLATQRRSMVGKGTSSSDNLQAGEEETTDQDKLKLLKTDSGVQKAEVSTKSSGMVSEMDCVATEQVKSAKTGDGDGATEAVADIELKDDADSKRETQPETRQTLATSPANKKIVNVEQVEVLSTEEQKDNIRTKHCTRTRIKQLEAEPQLGIHADAEIDEKHKDNVIRNQHWTRARNKQTEAKANPQLDTQISAGVDKKPKDSARDVCWTRSRTRYTNARSTSRMDTNVNITSEKCKDNSSSKPCADNTARNVKVPSLLDDVDDDVYLADTEDEDFDAGKCTSARTKHAKAFLSPSSSQVDVSAAEKPKDNQSAVLLSKETSKTANKSMKNAFDEVYETRARTRQALNDVPANSDNKQPMAEDKICEPQKESKQVNNSSKLDAATVNTVCLELPGTCIYPEAEVSAKDSGIGKIDVQKDAEVKGKVEIVETLLPETLEESGHMKPSQQLGCSKNENDQKPELNPPRMSLRKRKSEEMKQDEVSSDAKRLCISSCGSSDKPAEILPPKHNETTNEVEIIEMWTEEVPREKLIAKDVNKYSFLCNSRLNSSWLGKKTPTPKCTPSRMNQSQFSFLSNSLLNNRTISKSGMLLGSFKSLLKRSTPIQKKSPLELQELRKQEFVEKKKKEEERMLRREELQRIKVEEQRRKREQRMRKVAETREQKEKKVQEKNSELTKRLEERLTMTDKWKEERLKEEREKQKFRLKKQQEAEERRQQEEEERLRKLQEQEEDKKRHFEMLQRKKEFEEKARQKRIAEERHRQEDRDRQAEQDRLKQLEEERERMRRIQIIEQERLNKKAEREQLALEKQREYDQNMKERRMKLREMEQKRMLFEEKRLEEKRKRDAYIKEMLNQHINRAAKVVKPNLNTTLTVSSAVNKPKSPQRYNMTQKRHSSYENYDITDLKSDESTDEEDVPRKKIPAWAQGQRLKIALIYQHQNPSCFDKLFDSIESPDLNELFAKKRPRFNKRTSSAVWDSPILKP